VKKKLLLINPFPEAFHDRVGTGQGNIPPLNLGYIAALTPPNWEIGQRGFGSNPNVTDILRESSSMKRHIEIRNTTATP
jgi:hypothetical protein